MKKSLLTLLLLTSFACNMINACPVDLVYHVIKNVPIIVIPQKSPAQPLTVDISSGILTFSAATSEDYTLQLLDEQGQEVYSVFVPSGTTTVSLPSTLTGIFELRLVADTHFFGGIITL